MTSGRSEESREISSFCHITANYSELEGILGDLEEEWMQKSDGMEFLQDTGRTIGHEKGRHTGASIN